MRAMKLPMLENIESGKTFDRAGGRSAGQTF